MDPSISSGPSLSSRLSEPIESTAQLLELLVPPLIALDLVFDLPSSFLSRFRSPESIDPNKFVKRQLGFVQKILVEKVWPDWEKTVEAEEGTQGSLVFERWFIPPPVSTLTSTIGAKVAISSYAVLSSMLSTKTASTLQPRSLEIISDLLVKLQSAFNFSDVYNATLGQATRAKIVEAENSDEEDEQIDPASLSAWEQSIRDLLGIPVRVANAWGSISEKRGTRIGASVPVELTNDSFESNLTSSYFDLLWALTSPSSTIPIYPSAISTPLRSLLSSPSFLPTAIPVLVPRILPPTTFPTPAEDLIHRQKHIDLLRIVIGELPDRDSSRLLRNLLSKLQQDFNSTSTSTSISAKSASFVLEYLFGPLEPTSEETWKIATEVLLDRNCIWDVEFVPQIVVFWIGGQEKAIVGMLDKVKEVWGNLEEMKSGFELRRTYLTSLLLVLIASLPRMHPSLVSLSRSPLFLSAVATSLHTISPLSRLFGMLVAEYVSNRSVDSNSEVQPLDFGESIWEGEGIEKDKIRELRKLFEEVEKGLEVEGWKELLRTKYSAASNENPVDSKPRTRHNAKPIQPTSVEEPPQTRPKRPLISIIGSDDEDEAEAEETLKPYPLPAQPSNATLEALSSSDPSLYQSAYSTPSAQPSQTRRRGKLRPPVYIFELTEYLRGKDPEGTRQGQNKEEADQEAERVEMALKEGEGLIRRKSGWGNELRENAVHLAIALMSLQDNYELDNFEESRQKMLVALIVGCPVEVAPCVIEQYFMPTYSISQLHTFLTSLALAARELAQLPIPSVSSPTGTVKPQQPLFPSKQLPPAFHRRLLGSQPEDQLQILAADLTNLALSGAREDAETTLPGAAREKLLSVRKFNNKSSSLSKSSTNQPTTPTYTTLCAECFILPLLNRFWVYLRDTATSTLYTRPSSSSKGSYAGGPSSSPILQPLLLSKYLTTVSILLHAARHAPTFLAVLAPEALALVVSLRPPTSSTPSTTITNEEDPGIVDQDLVLSAEMELILLLLSSSHSLDGGQTLTRSSFELLSEVQSWAEEVFEMEENKSGGAAVGRSGRAAAGVLLRLEEILGRWRGRVGWE
ncbi:Tel2p [Sporobolomyces salmoneus]|uniref:Tel2p n=1 Tax=Sporobolomyces salmoneus TaxID=183962 RepID=UPI0031777639